MMKQQWRECGFFSPASISNEAAVLKYVGAYSGLLSAPQRCCQLNWFDV
jgi:hypothetical protein